MSEPQAFARIAVLLPAYNAVGCIGACLASLLAQTYAHFDVWVIDDGSTDGTAEVVGGFKDTRIRLLKNPRNLGLVETLNRGLELIVKQGGYAYLARMDADDVCLPGRFTAQIEHMERNPEQMVCGTATYVTGQESGVQVFPLTPLGIRYASLGMVAPFCHPTVMMRIGLIEQGEVVYEAEYSHAEDARLWSTLAKRFALANLSARLLVYRLSDTSISSVHARQQRLYGDKVIADDYAWFLGRALTETEKRYVLHQFKAGEFARYLAFYRDVLASIVAREPGFMGDWECRQLVARAVCRTVLYNRVHMRSGEIVVLARGLLLEGMGVSMPRAAWLVLRCMVVTKVLCRRNGF